MRHGAPTADGEHLLPQVSTPNHRDHRPEREASPASTHFRQLRQYLEGRGRPAALVTPFSWARPLIGVFGRPDQEGDN
jgi:hypothetical protein